MYHSCQIWSPLNDNELWKNSHIEALLPAWEHTIIIFGKTFYFTYSPILTPQFALLDALLIHIHFTAWIPVWYTNFQSTIISIDRNVNVSVRIWIDSVTLLLSIQACHGLDCVFLFKKFSLLKGFQWNSYSYHRFAFLGAHFIYLNGTK